MMEEEMNYLSNKIEDLDSENSINELTGKRFGIDRYNEVAKDIQDEREILENILSYITENELKYNKK